MSDQTATDYDALVKLIHANRISAWLQDNDTYQRCFVHAPYTTRWNASPLSGIFVRHGWDEIAQKAQRMSTNKAFYDATNAHQATVEDLSIRISGDMAWATYRQRYPNPALHQAGASPSEEVRIFERHDGEWRIAFLGFLDVDQGRPEIALLTLDPDGTVGQPLAAAAAALASDDDLVIRNGKLHIRNSKADQKLQAAIRWAAAQNDILIPKRGALPIVLEAGEGVPVKVWWVIAQSGKILFSLGPAGIEERHLDAATIVYGLSPAQRRVAGQVLAGRSLAEIAQDLSITVNTARTHLDRVFDKTGVRTQTALVRALLSAAVPL